MAYISNNWTDRNERCSKAIYTNTAYRIISRRVGVTIILNLQWDVECQYNRIYLQINKQDEKIIKIECKKLFV